MNHSKKSTGTWHTCLVFLGCLFLLTACGGGGGGPIPPPPPPPPVHTLVLIHTKVSGLVLPGLVLQNNGADDLSIPGDGLYNFKTPLALNSSYNVTISSQPDGSLCTAVNGTGTVGEIAPVISVVCAATGVTIGGTVKGLTPDTTLILNNNGNDLKTVMSDGVFVFDKQVAHNSGYTVTVKAQPPDQICTVSNSSGEAITQPVTNIVVTCSASALARHIEGTVTGLAQNNQITLKNNSADPLLIKADGKFVFTIANLSSYHIIVANQPANQTCTVIHGSGAGVDKDINNVAVNCSAVTFTVGGTVTGLAPDTQVTLLNNGADPLHVTAANGKFTFHQPVAQHGNYLITVGAQPQGQICTVVANYMENDVNANITDVAITCSTKRYTISGTMTGLQMNSPITLYNNGADPKTVLADGPFTFNTPVAEGGSYVVTIGELPFIQSCQVGDGTGNNVTANVKTVQLTCSAPVYQDIQYFDYSNGADPKAKLIQDSSGYFYGTTQGGGNFDRGTVFRYKPGNNLQVLYHFGFKNDEPKTPQSELVLGRDGNLYGTSRDGGLGYGTVFMINPDGSQMKTLVPFSLSDTSSGPISGLVEGSDGAFYGTTTYGGLHNWGSIFRVVVDPVTKTGQLERIYSFTGGNDGAQAFAGLVRDGDLFYGATQYGGEHDAGTIYTLTSDAKVETIYSFNGVRDSGSNEGLDPRAALVKGADGYFYGTTFAGGKVEQGTLFQFDPIQKSLKTFVQFSYSGVVGARPFSALIQGSDGSFYGTTSTGTGNQGTVFRFTPPLKEPGDMGELKTLKTFPNGASPGIGLLQGSDSKLYGVTEGGGQSGRGLIFTIGATN